ncbi:uncharacterized protein LOC118428675 [Branchiostoma floridae]|uniref:Uncharacterized protein LOC118428675 n=1 Tax=Branchiostoma floridae TaxID=7739 RepID=A0A9J7N637_BRAFL|nr:uncharacterized protein LOC118428675 [Branchiostoma floridae]
MSDVTCVVIADMECSEDIFFSVLEEDMPGLLKGIIEESVSEEKAVVTIADKLLEETAISMAEEAATDAMQVDDVTRDIMGELLEEGIMAMATEEATGAIQLDAASWEVMEAFIEEAQTLMIKEIATSDVQVDAGAWEGMEQLIEEGITEIATEVATGTVQTDGVAWEELEDLLGEVTKAMTEEVAGSAVQQHAMAWDLMQVLLGEVTEVMTEEVAANAVQLDAVAWEVMRGLLEEVPAALLAAEEFGVAPPLVQQNALAWEELEEVLGEVTEAMSEEVSTRAVRVDDVTWEVMGELIEEAKWMMTEEVATDAVQVDSIAWEVMKKLLREVTNLKATATTIALEEHEEWHLVMDVMEGILDDISMATAKSVALEVDEEVRLGQTVPEEYNKQSRHPISAAARAVQYLELPAGVRLAIPPGATRVDTSVISAVLNPHGAGQTVALGEEELLVSDILELRPAGLSFSRPVTLRIPHAVPRFHLDRQFVVKTSEDGGKTWRALNTRNQHKGGQHFATVEVSHFSEFVVTARPLERFESVQRGLSAVLRSSPQTDVQVELPRDCGPQHVGFKVLPVDADTLTCAAMAPDGIRGVGSMSHIVRFCKNLLLSSPATVVLPLAPGTGHLGGRVRVLSCNDSGRWEDITASLDDIVLQGSRVAFRTDQLRAGFAAVRCDILEDPTATVTMVTKNIRARIVSIVIFKKWREPREAGVMTARIECVIRERVEDHICHMEQEEGFQRQDGTPTPPIVLMEGEDICVTFEGRIRPEGGPTGTTESTSPSTASGRACCSSTSGWRAGAGAPPPECSAGVPRSAGRSSPEADNTTAGTPEAGSTDSCAEAAATGSSPSCASGAMASKDSSCSTVANVPCDSRDNSSR